MSTKAERYDALQQLYELDFDTQEQIFDRIGTYPYDMLPTEFDKFADDLIPALMEFYSKETRQ